MRPSWSARVFACATKARAAVIARAAEILNIFDFVHCNPIRGGLDSVHGRGTRDPASQTTQGPTETPQKMELHMTFLPQAFRKPEFAGLLAAIPATIAGVVLFAYMLNVPNWLTV